MQSDNGGGGLRGPAPIAMVLGHARTTSVRLGRWGARAGRTGIVLFSVAIVASMVASVVAGPIGDRVLAEGGYGKRAQDAGIITTVLFGGEERAAPEPQARRAGPHADWRRVAAYTPVRRHPATAVRWHAPVPTPTGGAPGPAALDTADAGQRLGGHKAVCVRLCDGYFFPMGDIEARTDVDSRTSLCAGLCPGAPTRLFVTPGGTDDMDRATAISTGQSYASLPVAFAHTRGVGPTCACHPEGEEQAVAISPLADFTMRSGDSVMTPAGWRVFQGADHWPYRRDDFQSIRNARNLPSRTRSMLARMEDATFGRQATVRLRPLLVTPRLRVADTSTPGRPADAPADRSAMRRIGSDTLGGP